MWKYYIFINIKQQTPDHICENNTRNLVGKPR